MVEESTKEWLQRLAYGYQSSGKSGERHATEGSEHARRILAALDDADRDDRTLAAIEQVAPNADDLTGSIARVVGFRERLIAFLPEYPELNDDQSQLDDYIVAMFATALDFRADVRALLIGTGVLAETDQASNPIDLLRLFLPSPPLKEAAE